MPNAVEAFHENNLLNEGRGPLRKAILARKRSRNGCTPEGYEADEGDEQEEKGIAWLDEELLESSLTKDEPIFDLQKLIC